MPRDADHIGARLPTFTRQAIEQTAKAEGDRRACDAAFVPRCRSEAFVEYKRDEPRVHAARREALHAKAGVAEA
jgi:hypothetical protein